MNARDKIHKLEQMTEARGATPAEAATARRLAARLRGEAEPVQAPGITVEFPRIRHDSPHADVVRDAARRMEDELRWVVRTGSVWDAMGGWRP